LLLLLLLLLLGLLLWAAKPRADLARHTHATASSTKALLQQELLLLLLLRSHLHLLLLLLLLAWRSSTWSALHASKVLLLRHVKLLRALLSLLLLEDHLHHLRIRCAHARHMILSELLLHMKRQLAGASALLRWLLLERLRLLLLLLRQQQLSHLMHIVHLPLSRLLLMLRQQLLHAMQTARGDARRLWLLSRGLLLQLLLRHRATSTPQHGQIGRAHARLLCLLRRLLAREKRRGALRASRLLLHLEGELL